MLDQLVRARGRALAEHDDRGDRLDPDRVGHGDHRDFRDCRVSEQGVLDLAARDEDAARVDDVLHAIDDVEISFRVKVADVAGVEPAALEGLAGLLRLVPVALHQLRRAVDDLAALAGGYVAHIEVDHARLNVEDGAADRGGPGVVLLGLEHGRERRDLALAVGVERAHAG